MMVDNLNLSTLISQIPAAQKIHHPQLAQSEAQQALAQQMVQRRQNLEKIRSPRPRAVPPKRKWIPKDTRTPNRDNTPANAESNDTKTNSNPTRGT